MSTRASAPGALAAVATSTAPKAPAAGLRLLGVRQRGSIPRPDARDQLVRDRLAVLGRRARGLAAILDETHRPAEAAAARNLAALAESMAELVPMLPADWRPPELPHLRTAR